MRALLLVVGTLLLAGCTKPSQKEPRATFSATYDAPFRRLKTVELSDLRSRIERLGESGKALQPDLEALQRGQAEVMELLVKATTLRQQSEAEKKPALLEEALQTLRTADGKTVALVAARDALKARVNATPGAPPEAPPEPTTGGRD